MTTPITHPLESDPDPSTESHHRLEDEDEDDVSSSSGNTSDEFDFIESTWENGVETGLIIQWPSSSIHCRRPLHLSTKLTEDCIAPLFHGTQWAGTRVWKAAIVALEYLLKEYYSNPPPTSTITSPSPTQKCYSLLELGCGLGVPSMLWHLLQEPTLQLIDDPENTTSSPLFTPLCPPRVVLTDMPDLLPQLKDNLQHNFKDYYGPGGTIQARALDWSAEGLRELWNEEKQHDPTSNNKKPVFDICLNCDCIYEQLYGRESWVALADVLAEVARLSPQTVLVTSVERRNGDGLEAFLERLEATGTVQTPIRRVLQNADDPHHVIEIYVARGLYSE